MPACRWSVIESLPVHEDIKRKSGHYQKYIENYKQSLRNVSACGLQVVVYNFMPLLDWVRTDIAFQMPDKSLALRFEKLAFIAFDLFMLKRPGAEKDYTDIEKKGSRVFFDSMTGDRKRIIVPECFTGFTRK